MRNYLIPKRINESLEAFQRSLVRCLKEVSPGLCEEMVLGPHWEHDYDWLSYFVPENSAHNKHLSYLLFHKEYSPACVQLLRYFREGRYDDMRELRIKDVQLIVLARTVDLFLKNYLVVKY